MGSNQTRRGDQFEGMAAQRMVDRTESEAELGIRHNNGFKSSLVRLDDAISESQYATGLQDYGRRLFRRDNINDSTRKARTRDIDGRFLESESEAIHSVGRPWPTSRGTIQGWTGSRHAHNTGQHRHRPTTSHLGLDRGNHPQLIRQEEHQARPNTPSLREQALDEGRKSVNEGRYWKPNPGAGCQKAPPVGGSRGFNPSGTVPDYGGLEIWHDDEGKIVERRGRGGKDDGSFDA